MDFLKKFGFWILCGMVALGAVAFYFLLVRAQGELRAGEIDKLESRKNKLSSLAGQGAETKNKKWIDQQGELAELVAAEIKECQRLIVHQRRDNEVKLFGSDDGYGALKKEVANRSLWRQYYLKHVARVKEQLEASGVASAGLVSFPDYWGQRLPSWGEIRNAQVHFWLRKDMVDLLTNQHAKDIVVELKYRGEPRLVTLLDVVLNPKPGTLSSVLQAMPKKTLAAVLQDVVANSRQADLAEIFTRYGVYKHVRDITMDKRQQQFLRDLRSRDKDRNDLADFIMDLRMVRYREDLVGLFKNNGFPELASRLRDWGPTSRNLLIDDISSPRWRPLRLAGAIEAAVAIVDERDMNVILRNHRVRLASISTLTFENTEVFAIRPTAGRGGNDGGGGDDRGRGDDSGDRGRRSGSVGARRGVEGVYHAFPFSLSVTMEFRHIPVLVRRLLMSDWRIEIQGISVGKASRPDERRSGRGSEEEKGPGGVAIGAEGPGGGKKIVVPKTGFLPGGAPVAEGEGEDAEDKKNEEDNAPRVAPRNYVKVDLRLEARQFYPLWKAQNPEKAAIIEAKFKKD